jgi:hypothetical protein
MFLVAALHPAPAVHVAASSLSFWIWLLVIVAVGLLGGIAVTLRR